MEEDYLDVDRLSQGDTNPTQLASATQFKDYLRVDTRDIPRIQGYCSTILRDTIYERHELLRQRRTKYFSVPIINSSRTFDRVDS